MDISENAMSLGPQEVQEVHKVTADPLNLESAMVLQIPEEFPGSGVSGVRKVARLLTHCSPKKYLNFKVKMFETEDLDFVGGELGSAPRKRPLEPLLSQAQFHGDADGYRVPGKAWSSRIPNGAFPHCVSGVLGGDQWLWGRMDGNNWKHFEPPHFPRPKQDCCRSCLVTGDESAGWFATNEQKSTKYFLVDTKKISKFEAIQTSGNRNRWKTEVNSKSCK